MLRRRAMLAGFGSWPGADGADCTENDVTLNCGCPGAMVLVSGGVRQYCTPTCPEGYAIRGVENGTLLEWRCIDPSAGGGGSASATDAGGAAVGPSKAAVSLAPLAFVAALAVLGGAWWYASR